MDRSAISGAALVKGRHIKKDCWPESGVSKSNPTKTTLNPQGLVASVEDATAHTSTFAYDAFGDLTKATDPAGNTVTAAYDLRGRETAVSDPDLGSWSFAYDVLSELKSQ